MMNSVSFESCGMFEKEISNYCKDKDPGTTISSNENDLCCNTKIVADPLTENFISAFTEIQKLDVKDFVYTLLSEILISKNKSNTSFASDNSPPETYSNSIYLNNSILLI
jgi:hypothetical protein